jgi:CHAT domain-containing protein
MKPEGLVAALLEAKDVTARQALLSPHDEKLLVAVVELLKEAVDHERLRDPHAALRIAEIGTEVAHFTGVSRCQALAAWAQGNALIHLGDYAECLRLYQQATQFFAAEGMEIEAARLIANQAFVLKNLGRYGEGVEAAQRALTTLRKSAPSIFLGSALNGLATLYRLLRRYDDALATFAECEEVYSALGDKVRQARMMVNKSNVLENLDRFEEAITLLRQARAVLADHEQHLEVARTDLNLGITYSRLGRYDEALEALDRAEKGFLALDNALETAVVALYRAELYASFNLYDEVLQTSTRDWQLFEEREMQWQAARAALHRAVAWRRLGEVTQAEELLTEALAVFDRVGDTVWVRLASLERATMWSEMGEWARALPVAVETATFFREKGMPVRAAGSALLAAQCHLALGQVMDASQRYAEVLNLAQAWDVLSLRYRAHHGLGQVADRQGNQQEAYELLIASISAPSAAGEVTEGGPVARLQALREQLNWHYSKLKGGSERERGGIWTPPEAEVWERITAIEQEMIHVWRELQQASPFYAFPTVSSSCTLSMAQTCLRQNEILLQYYVAGEIVYVFVVGHDGSWTCRSLTCTPSQIDDVLGALDTTLRSVSSFGGEYAARTLGSLSRQQLGWLYDNLVSPLVPFLRGASRLLVAPDGLLFEVPFQALYDGECYLLERYEVAYTPSASTLRLCRENEHRSSAGRGQAFVLGYSQEDKLPYVRQEVEAVTRALPGAMTFTDDEATRAHVREHAGRSSLLHLATHAVFRRDNPLFSALQLAGGDWLRVMDLYSLQLNGALVTLSGCETGRHRLLGGDLLGLSRGFFYAGASTLMISLWPVDDASTAQLMERFYACLATGEAASAALRQAQLALYASVEERDGRQVQPYTHPFYWAPFCLMGAPDLRLA